METEEVLTPVGAGTATDKGIDLLVSMTAELFEALLCVKWWNLPQKYKGK